MFFIDLVCNNSHILEIILFIKKLLNVVCIIVPILLIVMITVDFAKDVIATEEKVTSKNNKLIILRIISCCAIFLIPTVINLTMDILGDIGINFASCISDATIENIKKFKESESQEQADYENELYNFFSYKNALASNTKASFKLNKTNITLGHYKNKVNTYTLKVLDKSGKEMSKSNYTFKSSNPAVAKVSKSGVITALFGGNTIITVTSKETKEKVNAKVVVVHSLYTKAKTTKKLTVKDIVTGKETTLKAGTTGILNGIGPTKYPHSYTKGKILKVGNNYYSVSTDSVKATKYYIEDKYSQVIAEDFVNSFGFSSKTKYLLWSNHGSQTLYFFKGSKGKWRLTKIDNVGPTMAIGTGDVLGFVHSECDKTRPCPTGVIFDNKIKNTYNLANYSKKLIGKRGNPLHQTWGGKIGTPLSHGCTRVKSIDKLLGIHSKIKNSRYIDY